MKQTSRKFALAIALAVLVSAGGPASSKPEFLGTNPRPSPAQAAIPLAGRVTDAAHILSQHQMDILSAKLEKLEKETKHQMVIVTTQSLGGRDIEGFAKDLANNWGIGRKGFDDGVVILVAPQEHWVRIEVGYGLEKRLSNDLCKKITDQQVLPRFRQSDFFGGINSGAETLIGLLK